ncbi:MAG: GAF domain-containing protein [Mycobacteriales bacterium]
MSEPLDAAIAELAHVADLIGPGLAPTAMSDLLRAITSTARELFGAAACSLALLSEDESELVFTSASGEGESDVGGLRIPSTTGIAGWVVMSGQPIAVSDLRSDARFAGEVAETTGYVPTTLLAVPVQTPDRILGVVEVLDRDQDRADAGRDMELLTQFAGLAGLAIEAEQAFWNFGKLLLRAAATTTDNVDLISALNAVAAGAGDDHELADLAAMVAELRLLPPAERRLAVSIVRSVTAHARGRDQRPA